MKPSSYLFAFLVLALLASLLGNYVQHDLPRDKVTASEAVRSINIHRLDLLRDSAKAVTRAQDSVISFLQNKRKSDSTIQAARTKSFLIASNAFKRDVARLKQERAEEGTVIDPKTLLVEAKQDSLISSQTKEIEALGADKTLAEASFNQEIEAINAKLNANMVESSQKDLVITDCQKANQNLKRGNRVLKGVLVVLGGWLILENVKD